jgi:tartrate dehydratase alpha subunit/fumarate hydratase class I-like protein
MQDVTEKILELVRLTSTDLPSDVETSIHQALEQEEPGSAARGAFETILKNVEPGYEESIPAPQLSGFTQREKQR